MSIEHRGIVDPVRLPNAVYRFFPKSDVLIYTDQLLDNRHSWDSELI